MAYTNSSMVSYTKLSPNHSGQRTHSIDRITPHCVVGQCSVETLVTSFCLHPGRQVLTTVSAQTVGSVCMWRKRTAPGAHLLLPMTREPSPLSAPPTPQSRMRLRTPSTDAHQALRGYM